ncbi:MAG: helix-turn-helix domain-containing protein [Moorea sp. SIO2B7]|nr:helix-turn-helix domain-containing protein [Moorena sp. SIO2B7]
MELVGTKEAAYLLGICCQRVRQLLKEGRIKGAEKLGRFWQIPLHKGMPKVEKRTRGPAGSWRKRQPQTFNYITVNRKKIAQNKKEGNSLEKVLSVKRGKNKTVSKCHYVEINGPSRLVYQPNSPLHCGATVWIEADPSVELITGVFATMKQSRDILVAGELRAT